MDMVSIIMPTFNRANIIASAIYSALNQTWEDIELIIVDDGSEDETREIVSRISDRRIWYIKNNENRGSSYARNVGMSIARGDYIAFLDSDNTWETDYLKNRLSLIGSMTDSILSFGRMRFREKDGGERILPIGDYADLRDKKTLIKMMLFDNKIDTNTVVMNRSCYINQTGFDERYKSLEDWEFFFRIISDETCKVIFDENIVGIHNDMADSLSRQIHRYWINRIRFLTQNADMIDQYGVREELEENIVSMLSHTNHYKDLYVKFIEGTTPIEQAYFLKLLTRGSDRKEQDLQNAMDKTGKEFDLARKLLKHSSLRQSLEAILRDNEIASIAIYGFGYYGEMLYKALLGGRVIIKAVIDRTIEPHMEREILFSSDSREIKDVDAIIISIANNAEMIKKDLKSRIAFPIYTLEELL